MPEADRFVLLGHGELAFRPVPHDWRVADVRASILLPELRITPVLSLPGRRGGFPRDVGSSPIRHQADARGLDCPPGALASSCTGGHPTQRKSPETLKFARLSVRGGRLSSGWVFSPKGDSNEVGGSLSSRLDCQLAETGSGVLKPLKNSQKGSSRISKVATGTARTLSGLPGVTSTTSNQLASPATNIRT